MCSSSTDGCLDLGRSYWTLLFVPLFLLGVLCDVQKRGAALWLPWSSWKSPGYTKRQQKSCSISSSSFRVVAVKQSWDTTCTVNGCKQETNCAFIMHLCMDFLNLQWLYCMWTVGLPTEQGWKLLQLSFACACMSFGLIPFNCKGNAHTAAALYEVPYINKYYTSWGRMSCLTNITTFRFLTMLRQKYCCKLHTVIGFSVQLAATKSVYWCQMF